MQVIRDELVESFVTLVNQIKLDHAVRAYRLLPDYFERLEMLLEYRLETALHFPTRRNLLERVRRQLANNLLDERLVGSSFDHLHQLQRRLFQLDALRRRFVKRAIDDVRPVDQRLDRLRIKPETLVSNCRNKFRTRLARWIEKLSS